MSPHCAVPGGSFRGFTAVSVLKIWLAKNSIGFLKAPVRSIHNDKSAQFLGGEAAVIFMKLS
jgi:hypothetical protein